MNHVLPPPQPWDCPGEQPRPCPGSGKGFGDVAPGGDAAGMEQEWMEMEISRRKACTCDGNEGLLRCHIKMRERSGGDSGEVPCVCQVASFLSGWFWEKEQWLV